MCADVQKVWQSLSNSDEHLTRLRLQTFTTTRRLAISFPESEISQHHFPSISDTVLLSQAPQKQNDVRTSFSSASSPPPVPCITAHHAAATQACRGRFLTRGRHTYFFGARAATPTPKYRQGMQAASRSDGQQGGDGGRDGRMGEARAIGPIECTGVGCLYARFLLFQVVPVSNGRPGWFHGDFPYPC